jgi:hypothetical protein
MKKAIEDNELNVELQELYLVDKQWLSDLEFINTELAFLKKLAMSHSVKVSESERADIAVSEKTYCDLKMDLLAFLHQLEPLVTQKKKNIDLSIIETYTHLNQTLADALLNCKMLKKTVFGHSQENFSAGHVPALVIK